MVSYRTLYDGTVIEIQPVIVSKIGRPGFKFQQKNNEINGLDSSCTTGWAGTKSGQVRPSTDLTHNNDIPLASVFVEAEHFLCSLLSKPGSQNTIQVRSSWDLQK